MSGTTKIFTEDRIADAVITVIAEQGFDIVSVRSVARACNLSAGTVQYHFPTRQALLTAGLMRSFERQRTTLLSEMAHTSHFEHLRELLVQLLPVAGSEQEDAVAWISFVAAARSRPWVAQIICEAIILFQRFLVERLTVAWQEGQLLAGLTPETAARLISALLNGLTIDVVAARDNAVHAREDLTAGLALIVRKS